MHLFDRSITSGLKKRIAVFSRGDDGKYTHRTYSSLLDMSEQERLEYIVNALMQCDNEATEEQISATRENIKNILTAKMTYQK